MTESLEWAGKKKIINLKSPNLQVTISRGHWFHGSLCEINHFTSIHKQTKNNSWTYLFSPPQIYFPKPPCFFPRNLRSITIISIGTSYFHIELQDLQGIFQPWGPLSRWSWWICFLLELIDPKREEKYHKKKTHGYYRGVHWKHPFWQQNEFLFSLTSLLQAKHTSHGLFQEPSKKRLRVVSPQAKHTTPF